MDSLVLLTIIMACEKLSYQFGSLDCPAAFEATEAGYPICRWCVTAFPTQSWILSNHVSMVEVPPFSRELNTSRCRTFDAFLLEVGTEMLVTVDGLGSSASDMLSLGCPERECANAGSRTEHLQCEVSMKLNTADKKKMLRCITGCEIQL